MVPRSVNLTGTRDNVGHEKTTVNKLVIIGGHFISMIASKWQMVTAMSEIIISNANGRINLGSVKRNLSTNKDRDTFNLLKMCKQMMIVDFNV